MPTTEHPEGGEGVGERVCIDCGREVEVGRTRPWQCRCCGPLDEDETHVEAIGGTTQKPSEGITQADLDRGEELDEEFGWSHTAKDAVRLRKLAAEVHVEPDEEPKGRKPATKVGELCNVLRGLNPEAPLDPPVTIALDWGPPETTIRLTPQASHPALLSPDDAARLRSIASSIDLLVEQGAISGDFGTRDVRYLRKLARYAEKGAKP